MSVRTERFNIASINRTNTGNFSYKEGNPVIRFSMAGNDRLLDTSSLRLCCKVRVEMGDGSAPQNNDTQATPPVPANAIQSQLSANNGASSMISVLSITTGSGAQVETIRNYGRLAAQILQQTNSWGDYSTNLSYLHGATGNDKSEGRICNLASGNAGNMYSFSVCMPLLAGFLSMGNNVNLSNRNGTGGLEINLTLAPDVFSIFGKDAATLGGSTVVWENPVLTGTFIIPDDINSLPAEGTVPYSSWTSVYSVNQASDDQRGYNLGLSRVVSQFNNTIATEKLNNYAQNSSLTTELKRADTVAAGNPANWAAPTAQTTFMRNGVNFPLDFNVIEDRNAPPTAAALGADVYANSVFDVQRFLYSLDAILPYRQTSHLLAGGNSEGVANAGDANSKYNYGNPKDYDWSGTQDFVIDGSVYSCGVRYDMLNSNNSTADFKNSQFAERTVSRLDDTANSLFGYFLHKAAVNFGPNGVSVAV